MFIYAFAAVGAFTQTPKSSADEAKPKEEKLTRFSFYWQSTSTLQTLFKFRSRYEGLNSLKSRDEIEPTQSFTLFMGARIIDGLEFFIDPEWVLGNGFSNGGGLGVYPNGEVVGQTTLKSDPYIARAFLRWRIAAQHSGNVSGGTSDYRVSAAPNFLIASVPRRRIVITAGKLGVTDVFDSNAYANNARTQFLNYALTNNPSYDYAQDPRGYGYGLSVSYVDPDFAIRIGSWLQATMPGSVRFSNDLENFRSDQIELEAHPQLMRSPKPSAIVRFLLWSSRANMGSFQDAIDAAVLSSVPDVSTVRSEHTKRGIIINFEQALADGGNTGMFARWGYNDGKTEAYAFTETDRSLSFGVQVSGAQWHRPKQRAAAAIIWDDLSGSHRNYLAAGGTGFSLGDGALRYGTEKALETYFAVQVSKSTTLSLDYQGIINPGYSRDRGPASFFAFRAHSEF